MDTGCAKEFSEIRWLLIFQGASTSSHVRKLSNMYEHTRNILKNKLLSLYYQIQIINTEVKS